MARVADRGFRRNLGTGNSLSFVGRLHGSPFLQQCDVKSSTFRNHFSVTMKYDFG